MYNEQNSYLLELEKDRDKDEKPQQLNFLVVKNHVIKTNNTASGSCQVVMM